MRTTLVAAATLAATSITGTAGIGMASAQELTFWTWRQEDRAAYEEIFAAFSEANPGITVAFEAFEPTQYQTILSTALAGGAGPDIAHVRAYGNLEAIAGPGYLRALDGLVDVSGFSELALSAETLRADGQIYAVPFASQTLVIYYNTALFAEAGVEPPETWEQFIAACQALADAGIFPIANGTADAWQNEIMVGTLVPSFYGTDFEADLVAGTADFTDPRYVEALARLEELKPFLPDGFTGIDYSTAQQLFINEQAAMFAGGTWEIANFRSQNPDLAFEIMPSPAPEAGADRYVSTFFDGGFALTSVSEQEEAGLALLNYMATPDFGNQLVSLLGNISPIEGVEFTDPMIAEVAALNQTAVSYLMLVHFRYEEPSGSVLLQQAVQRMMAGEATPEEVGRNVTEGIATYHAPFQN